MAELTLAEITRWLEKHDQKHESFVPRELYDTVVARIKEDIAEVKEAQTWMLRLVVANLIGFLVYVLVALVRQAPT